MKKIIVFILRICISVGILIFLFNKIDLKEVLNVIPQFNPTLFVLAFFVFLSAFFMALFRWRMLLRIVEVESSSKRIIISYFGSQFFNLFLPSFIGADIMRSVDIGAQIKNVKRVAATVFLDRLSGYIGLLIIALVSLLLGFRYIKDPTIYLSVFLLSALLVGMLFFIFHQAPFLKITKFLKDRGKIQETIRLLYEEIFYFRRHPNALAKNVLISILIQASIPLTYYILLLALGIKFDPIIVFILVPIISAISIIPISIGGLGVREAGMVYFFAKFGLAQKIAVTISLVNFFFILIISILGGIVYVFTFHTRRI